MFTLSQRLKTVADMVQPCFCVADIGTDHGYIPIYLCQNGTCVRAVAGDVSQGSAQKACDNVLAYEMETVISVRCGDGIKIINKDDNVESVIIAGMGGMLMLDILQGGNLSRIKQLVLQPQKDVMRVRQGIHRLGYEINDEKMVFEDGKFYNIISAIKTDIPKDYTTLEYRLGKILLRDKDEILHRFINHEIEKINEIMPKVDS